MCYPLIRVLASEWLAHATPAIALLAMLTSLASFVLALKTFRRAGARVRVAYEVGTITDNRLKGDTKLPVMLRPNTSMDWAYRIRLAGLAQGSRLVGLPDIRPYQEIEDRIRRKRTHP
jgi:hypothetical protein